MDFSFHVIVNCLKATLLSEYFYLNLAKNVEAEKAFHDSKATKGAGPEDTIRGTVSPPNEPSVCRS